MLAVYICECASPECPATACTAAAAGQPRELAVAALDVESVLTTAGYEAARVTLLDGAGRRVLDGLVVPEHPVVDYVSHKSGERAAAAASRWWRWAVRDRRAGRLQPALGARRWCL